MFNNSVNNKDCNNVQWGSLKPVIEKCPPNTIQMKGQPCTNIWNNSTKRKIISIQSKN